MPVVGPPVLVTVQEMPLGTLVRVANRTGTRRVFRLCGQVLVLDGNTETGAVVEVPADELVVTTDLDGQVWPVTR